MALTHLSDVRREPFAEGASWGPAGGYEWISGEAHFAVDPTAGPNLRITDLGLAEAQDGTVHFNADFRLLRPASTAGSTRLMQVIPNRGRVGAVPFSLDAPWWNPLSPTVQPGAGDGFLLHQGWTVAWCGWQWDVIGDAYSLGVNAPEALSDGRPVSGTVRVDFSSEVRIADHALGDSGPVFSFRSYAAADVDQADAVMTVRDRIDGPKRVIERDRWRFARDEGGRAVTDDERVRLDGGFEPFRFYEVTYRTRRSPAVGVGLLAVRDFVSWLRHEAGFGGVSSAFGYGASQSGRFLRHFLHEAMNLDEKGRVVFDGVLPYVAGARIGEFNQRYGQPSYFSHSGIGSLPPFSPAAGVFERQEKAGGMPKVMLTNTTWEYYRGDAALNHIDPSGAADLPEPPGIRCYHLACCDHLGPSPVKALMPLTNPANDIDSIPALRAILTNLVAWATEGVEPPPSAVPTIAEGTAVTPEAATAAVEAPGVARPEPAGFPRARVTDLGPDTDRGLVRLPAVTGTAYPCLVPAPDDDGNDATGIRLPEVEVPVGTYTGWNVRRHVEGLPDTLIDFAGSRFPFAATAADARANGDPRPSLAERYVDRQDYAAHLHDAINVAVGARHLLATDAQVVFERALARYDRVVQHDKVAEHNVADHGVVSPGPPLQP